MPFHFRRLEMPDIMIIEPEIFGDLRGYFMETYKLSDFVKMGIKEHFVQENFSRSAKGVLRGLHYQKDPSAQGKLVQCLRGRIFDVAVDIRKGSLTYSQWIGVELSGENNFVLYVPAGFAHGFVVLSSSAEVLYKCTKEYSPENDRGIIWNDPDIKVQWPVRKPLLSGKDARHPRLKDADNNFVY
ncbi:MAG: dTDP-4-dehydrorhamnose 3,5-epimerase [Nitrospirota bacterium]